MDNKSILFIPGNNYTRKHVENFIQYLEIQPCIRDVFFIQLLENIYGDLPYQCLEPKAYSDYIFSKIPDKNRRYVIFASSMGCYHAQNFSHFFPDMVESIILLEPTMCGGVNELLIKFEEFRGNRDFIRKLVYNTKEDPMLLSNEKIIEMAISEDYKEYWFPYDLKGLSIIYTSHNAQGELYNDKQREIKNKFLEILREKGYNFQFYFINAPHAADTVPRFYKKLSQIICKTSGCCLGRR